MTEYIYIYEYI